MSLHKMPDGRKIFPLVDRITDEDKKALGLELDKLETSHTRIDTKTTPGTSPRFGEFVLVGAVMTGDYRPPKMGEWYISGAIPEAYRQPREGATIPARIATLVKYKTETIIKVTVIP